MADTPNVRFRGFADDWEQCKLGEIVDVCSGRDYKHLDDGDIPVYGTGGYMLSVSDALSEKDDAIGIGRKGTIDNPYILRAPFWTVDTLFYCIPKKNYYLDFVYSIYQNINWKAMDESTGVPSLSKTAINNVDTMVPSKAEQEKLGGYFTQIDHLITLHQRKCDETKELKKYMLQKMFPQNGKKIPEIRFAGFTNDWEQRKIKDIAPLQRGFDLPTSQMEEGVYPVVMSNGIGGYHSQYKVKGPGIVTGRSGTIGKLHYIENDYWPHNTTLWVTDFYGNNQKFIYYMYQCLDLSRFSTGSGVPTLNRNDVHDEGVYIPNVGEQKKISEYLTNLDHLITLHQRKCDELKEVKKFMLQNMFPQKG